MRINITLTEDEYRKLMMCYKDFISSHEWRQAPPTLTGYVAGLVNVSVDRIIDEEGLPRESL